MLPIAKAGVLLVLLGAGATGACALAGGFGSGNGEGTQKENAAGEVQKPNSDVVPEADIQTESSPREGEVPASTTPQNNPSSGGSADSASSQTGRGADDSAENPQNGPDATDSKTEITAGTSDAQSTRLSDTHVEGIQPGASSSTTITPNPAVEVIAQGTEESA